MKRHSDKVSQWFRRLEQHMLKVDTNFTNAHPSHLISNDMDNKGDIRKQIVKFGQMKGTADKIFITYHEIQM